MDGERKAWEVARDEARSSLAENRWNGQHKPKEPVELFEVTVKFAATMSSAQELAGEIWGKTGARPRLRRLRNGQEGR